MEDAALETLGRIEEKLDRLLTKAKADVVSPTECMPLTGCTSLSAQFRWFEHHKIKPYQRGKYIRKEITSEVIRTALRREAEQLEKK